MVPTVVVFAANPDTHAPLDLEGERRAIAAELHEAGRAGVLHFIDRPATTPPDVQRTMLVERPVVVQFSGHGQGQAPEGERGARQPTPAPRRPARDLTGIMLHDEVDDTSASLVSGEALGDLFAKAGQSVRLVVLNACYSDLQAAAILQHVDVVVGMNGPITDEAARVFAVALYRALALGRSIRSAFELGVNALMLAGLGTDVDLPVLRARPGADPDRITLVEAPAPDDGLHWDVYVAYAKHDRGLAHRLATELHQRHLRVFFDEWEIGEGEVRSHRREAGIHGSTHGVMILSPRTMEQPWVHEEYAALLDKAVMERKRLIPVLVGTGDANVPPFLRTRQPVDLRDGSGTPYGEGVEAIARALRGQRPGPPPRVR